MALRDYRNIEERVDFGVGQDQTRVDRSSSVLVTNIIYNEKGQRTDIYYGNGSKTRYDYDEETLRLKRMLTTRNTGSDILLDLNYIYDPVGNITEVDDPAQEIIYYNNTEIKAKGKYTYDALYRLKTATGRELRSLQLPNQSDFANNIGFSSPEANSMQNYTQQFQYDELGNLIQMQSVNEWTRDYFYDFVEDNYLLGHTENTIEYSYDEHEGGALKKYLGDIFSERASLSRWPIKMPHLSSMLWDYKDELKEVTLNASNDTAYYVYDASGERVRKVIEKTGGIVEERVYMGGFEVYRKSVAGTLDFERETLHVSDDTKKIVSIETKTKENATSIQNPVPSIRYQYDNHLGSATLELDDSAAIISYEEYHPFGTTSYRSGRTETEVSLKRYKYVGKERDDETGLYYYGARYYAAWLGRFVSCDPMADHPKNITNNPYCYVSNNPINNIDPSGMIWDKTNKSDEKAVKFQEKLDNKKTAIDEEISVVSGVLENTKDLSEKDIASYKEKLSNLKGKQLEVSNAITELAEMGSNKDVVFRLEPTWNQPGNETFTNVGNGFVQEGVDTGKTSFKNGKVVMQYDKFSDDAMAHELKHGYQFLVGELSFDRKTGNAGVLYDLTDEQAAWKRGSLFSTELTGELTSKNFIDLSDNGYNTKETQNLNLSTKMKDLYPKFGFKLKDNSLDNKTYGEVNRVIPNESNDINRLNIKKM